MYNSGKGINQDPKQAFKWYKYSADQGYGLAQLCVGGMYAIGVDGKQDAYKAKYYFGLACENKIQEGCDAYKEVEQYIRYTKP